MICKLSVRVRSSAKVLYVIVSRYSNLPVIVAPAKLSFEASSDTVIVIFSSLPLDTGLFRISNITDMVLVFSPDAAG